VSAFDHVSHSFIIDGLIDTQVHTVHADKIDALSLSLVALYPSIS